MSQHIVSISFDFNEDKIRGMIEENAKEMVIGKLTTDIERAIVNSYSYYDRNKTPDASDVRSELRSMVYNEIDEFLEKNKEAIIESAASRLAERLVKTKAAKTLKEGLASAT